MRCNAAGGVWAGGAVSDHHLNVQARRFALVVREPADCKATGLERSTNIAQTPQPDRAEASTRRRAGSWLVARGSWLVARGSWLVARGSWLVALTPTARARPDASQTKSGLVYGVSHRVVDGHQQPDKANAPMTAWDIGARKTRTCPPSHLIFDKSYVVLIAVSPPMSWRPGADTGRKQRLHVIRGHQVQSIFQHSTN